MTTAVLRIISTCIVISMLIIACSIETEPPPSTPTTLAPAITNLKQNLLVAIATTDIALGPNRFAFGVLSKKGAIRVPDLSVAFTYLDATPSTVTHIESASFSEWPTGTAGIYVTETSFDRAGRWGVILEIMLEPGTKSVGHADFLVREKSLSPGIGDIPPSGKNRTQNDVMDLIQLTTAPIPDPDLYQLTIESAMDNEKPTIITFASPAFCSTATCGPQVLVLSAVKNLYKNEANFIHVDVYDNPLEMDGDIEKGVPSPLIKKWNLPSEPFTFVLDSSGRVSDKFQGFVTETELENALSSVLNQ